MMALPHCTNRPLNKVATRTRVVSPAPCKERVECIPSLISLPLPLTELHACTLIPSSTIVRLAAIWSPALLDIFRNIELALGDFVSVLKGLVPLVLIGAFARAECAAHLEADGALASASAVVELSDPGDFFAELGLALLLTIPKSIL